MTTKPNKALAELEKRGAEIREELKAADQSRLFALAVEAGTLAAASDGTIDDDERATLARAIEILSVGGVIEWETETLLDECLERTKKEGAEARAKAVGEALAGLNQAEAGVFIAGVVAAATGGVDKAEAEAIKGVAKAAGLTADKTKAIIKKAMTFAEGSE
jgi:tellurite resistance protein